MFQKNRRISNIILEKSYNSNQNKTNPKLFLSQNDSTFTNNKSSRPSLNLAYSPKKYKTNLSDLKKTYSINIEILKNFLKQNNSSKSQNKGNNLSIAIQNVQNSYNKYFSIVKKIKDHKSRLLIETQILFDKRRKFEETFDDFKQRIHNHEEAIDKKEEYIKSVQKKLKEVDKYIHRITRDMKNITVRNKYQQFTIKEFLSNYDNNIKEKEKLTMEKENIVAKIIIEKNNMNKYLIEKFDFSQKNKKNNSIGTKNKDTIKKCIEKYKKKLKNIYLKISILKKHYETLTNRYKYLDDNIINVNKIQQSPIQKKKIFNLKNKIMTKDVKEEEKDKLQFNISRKLNTYMDFSSILNNNNKIEESQFNVTKAGNNFDNILNNTNKWDISEIVKKD